MRFKNRRSGSKGKTALLLLFFIICLGVGAGFILYFEGDHPVVTLEGTGEFIGKEASVSYTVKDLKSGVQSIQIWAEQNGKKELLESRTYPRNGFQNPVGPQVEAAELSFEPLKSGFKDGPVKLTLEATDFSLRGWFKGNRSVVVKNVTLDTLPPRIQILHSEKYIFPGGTGIAIYKLSDEESIHGVSINGNFNAGFLLGDGREDTYISFFALPFDSEKIESQFISARDSAGNSTKVPFTTIYKKARHKKDIINVSQGFLNRKIPEFQQHYPEMQGEFIDKYLYANGIVRRKNNSRIADICANTDETRLWTGVFKRMAGSSRAGFADHRTYTFGGRDVDRQVHLGMDIASTRRAEVKAANRGKVAFNDYLGIYGNMVMLDHGQGVFSLYSHMSQINVSTGDLVEQGSVVGLTGTTGMAGGDHLHFSMLVHGIFVTPKEWWDKKWIEVTIEEPITDSKF